MFLHLSVILFRGVWQTPPQADTQPWADTHPRQTPPWADTPPGQTPPWADTPPGRHPQETATAAEGTHPTGMQSCLKKMRVNILNEILLFANFATRFCSGQGDFVEFCYHSDFVKKIIVR